jgi:hypothetical protein
MEANDSSAFDTFGQQHFGACDFADKRLTRRAMHAGQRILEHPGGTLPEKLNRNADLIGLYRLANNPKVTHEKIIAAHCRRTRELAGAVRVLLVLHDTTEADFSGLDVEELGPIGNGSCRGFLCHNSLAYDYDKREVLGLLQQTLHVRRNVQKRESPKAKRDHPDRESRLWKKGWAALGPPPAGVLRVNIADRGADLFEFIEAVQEGQDHYCIRSKSNRNILLENGLGRSRQAKLHNWARGLPTLGTRCVQVQANQGQKARQAVVRVAAGKVTIQPPHFARGEHSKQDQTSWVVHVREIQPPKNTATLEWILLTNVAAEDFPRACRRIDWYACRAVIEEYHKAQKTGCGMELQQFTTAHALGVGIGLLSVVATQLLRLRDLSRNPQAATRAATEVVDAEYVHVLSGWRFGELRVMNIAEFCRALSKLGGHLNRTRDKPAGWLVLWRGWSKLQLLVQGAQAGRVVRCV